MNLMVNSKPSRRHVLILPGVVLLVACPVASQQVGRVEAFFGYAFARVDAAGRVPAFNANGGNATGQATSRTTPGRISMPARRLGIRRGSFTG